MRINKRLEVELVDMGGLRAMFEAPRLPFGLECRSETSFEFTKYGLAGEYIVSNELHPKDHSLLQTLIKRGDEHAKVTRGLIYYLKITAPRWLMVEMETYKVGTISLSGTSTMHIDCKGLNCLQDKRQKGGMPGEMK